MCTYTLTVCIHTKYYCIFVYTCTKFRIIVNTKRHMVKRRRERNSYMHTDEKATCLFAANVVILVITWFVFKPIRTVIYARCLLVVRVTFCPVAVRRWVAIQPPSIAIHLVQTKPVVIRVQCRSALTPQSIQRRSEYSLAVHLRLEAILINYTNVMVISVFELYTLLIVL